MNTNAVSSLHDKQGSQVQGLSLHLSKQGQICLTIQLVFCCQQTLIKPVVEENATLCESCAFFLTVTGGEWAPV